MATGTGLDAQIGFKTETTVGTAATPVNKFANFNSTDLTFTPVYLEGQSLQAGRRFKSVNQVGISRKDGGGKIDIPVMTKGFGWYWQHFIGSTGTAVVVSGGTLAFDQYHTPGPLLGKSFTVQVGKPEPATGTVKPFTYNGCKVTDWSVDIADNAKVTSSFSVDSWNEDTATALAAASYPAGNVQWGFADVTNFALGGSATTTSGKTTITGGAAVTAVVNSLSIQGKNNFADARYGIGNAGIKREQLENDFTTITGAFKAEFNSSNFIPQFDAGTSIALQIDLFGSIIESTTKYQLSFIIPTAKITKAPVVVNGADIVTVDGEFTVYDPDDGVNPPFQVHIVSTDSTVL